MSERPELRRLDELTWPEAEALCGATLLIPLGSCEQHGPHLPLDTDTRIAVALAERAATGLDAVALGPTLALGSSGEHAAFPGTLSIGTEALTTVLVELVRSAIPPFGRVVLVNGHGGNVAALSAAVSIADEEGRSLIVWSPSVPDADAHAGWFETSILLALDPGTVRLDRVEPGTTTPLAELLPALRTDGVRPHAPTGVLGDPTLATPERGAHLLEQLTSSLRTLLTT
ncbi:MAG: mycofactocin biosynthesis peptidyl-dipeptidase MftE [Acidimicrobiales bacterium]|nr:mycofactocin biosynthesis peptidyl-dipeptidase MftE [Acidimicrobiales bacterium]